MTTVIPKKSGLRPLVETGISRRRPTVVHVGDRAVSTPPTPRRKIEPGTIAKPVRADRRPMHRGQR